MNISKYSYAASDKYEYFPIFLNCLRKIWLFSNILILPQTNINISKYSFGAADKYEYFQVFLNCLRQIWVFRNICMPPQTNVTSFQLLWWFDCHMGFKIKVNIGCKNFFFLWFLYTLVGLFDEIHAKKYMTLNNRPQE